MSQIYHKLHTYLHKPFPLIEKRWSLLFLCSFIIAIFFLIVKPFNLVDETTQNPNLVLLGYGITSVFILLIDLILIPKIFYSFFNPDKWVLYKQFIWQFIILITATIVDYFYSLKFSSLDLSGFNGFFLIFLYSSGIALLLFISTNIYLYNKQLHESLKEAKFLNEQLEKNKNSIKQDKVTTKIFVMDGDNKEISIKITDLIYLSSEGNYVNLFYKNINTVKTIIKRIPLKNIEEKLSNYSSFFKCHRTYIINLDYIHHVEGNAQGYKLQLNHIEEIIPVSRSMVKEFKNRVQI